MFWLDFRLKLKHFHNLENTQLKFKHLPRFQAPVGTLGLARENSEMYQFFQRVRGPLGNKTLLMFNTKTFLLHPPRAQPSGQGNCILLLYFIHFCLHLFMTDLIKLQIQFLKVLDTW